MGEKSTGLSPWDLSPPRRPTLDDFNGAALENDDDAPDWQSMPTANLLNGEAMTECAMGQVVPNALVSVVFSGGAPVVDSGTSAAGVSPGAVSPIASGAVKVDRPQGVATGQVVVYWPANTFPSPIGRPSVSLNGLTPGIAVADWFTGNVAGGGLPFAVSGLLVKTTDPSGTATDLPFTVAIP